ncbi:MAG: methyltransferase domain-containing protein [Muribaculaceae bacterium]|nr:methyltransferase domain-containing protein [Muribaculaceae bacterium]
MKILSQYSGWGGLGSAFNERGGYSNYQTAKKLKELLGEDGYQEALKSTRSAFYTPAEVINPLWDLVESLGFKGGNILEGSAGIGNMLALMPREISDRSNIQAVEIDPTTGGILAQLYPDAKVDIQGFEKTKIPNNSVDLAITNVPFVTGLRVTDESGDKDLSRRFGNIHDFAMAKNVRKLKPGGLGIFITSAGTLDGSRDFRKWLVNEGSADVIGAFRLNNKTFGGTNVTSDIIVVRKRINGKPSGAAIDVSETIPVRTAHYSPTRYGETAKDVSMAYNRYFVDHPEHMAGEMQFNFENGETFRATSTGLFPKGDKPQQKLLDSWANDLKERLERANREEIFGSQETSAPKEDTRSREDSEAKEGSLVINSSGKFAIVENGEAVELGINTNKVKGYSKAEVFKDYTAIKKALEELLTYQTENEGETGELKSKIATLNKAYDAFVKKYGHFYKNNQLAWLRNDIDYPSLSALETVKESADNKGNKVISYGKTDIFSRRVVEKEKTPEPENVRDGVITSISLFGKLDVDYISKALGKTVEEVGREIIESGLGFENPEDRNIEVSYQYLSGNVRDKLELARANNEGGRYDRNIRALERVKPMDIPAHLIEFSLGSTWLPSKIYDQYVKEKTGLDVTFSPVGGSWVINKPYWTETEGNKAAGIYSKVLDKWYTGSDIIEAAMKNKTLEFKQSKKNRDGSTETIADPEATAAVGAKVDEYRQDFKDWLRGKLQEDPDFSKDIAEKYNYQFNNYVPLTIPEEFVPQRFPGSVTSMGGVPFSLRPHQSRAVIKASTEPVLFAHEVGTGKTYTLITSAMEMRRLGLAQKPMIVVQNATLGQFVDSAKQLYPNAKILTLTDKDRTKEGRLGFYAKIKYNDWDMIVVPQSVFDMIPDSPQREAQYISDKIEEKRMVLDRLIETSDGRDPMVRRAQKELEDLENQLVAITESANKGGESVAKQKQRITALENAEARAKEMLDRRTDSVENFDDMGIDAILVDEAHEYKHLGFTTAMQRGVKGVDPSYSKKAQGLYLKTQAVRDRKGNRNIVFATGTPISNTAAEVWTFMRYLMPEEMMKDYDIYYFDDFVRNFGSLQQMLEFTTSGKFKENNRFAGYTNLPELARLWSSVADIVLTSEAGAVRDKIPAMEGEKAQDIYLPQTQELRSIMKYVKAELQKFEEMTGAEKRQNSHIPLTMYGIANAAAIDPRLVKDGAMDEPNSKTNEAVRQTLQALKDSEKYKGTVAIFSDKYQNQRTGFNLYEDIKKKLVAEGVREDEIAIMKPGMKIEAKQKLFDKVNNGEVRVILGSTQTLGTGVNIQERLFGLIHLDAPNRPMDYWQRMGRILRQGNLFKEWGIPVRVLRFGVEDSLDVTAYQRLKTKGAIADSIMHSKDLLSNAMENRVMEEEEDVFGDTIAQLSGSEYAMLKSQAEKQVRKLEGQKKSWQADQMYVTRQIPRIKEAIEKSEKDLETTQRGLEEVKKHFPDGEGAEIKVGHSTYTDPGEMGEFFKDYNSKIKEAQNQVRGTAEGNKETRNLTVKIGGVDFNFTTTVESSTRRGNDGGLFAAATTRMTYSSPTLGIKERHVEQALLRNGVEDILNNVITGSQFEKEAEAHRDNISLLEKELKALEPRQGEPFKYEKELMEATARLEDYTEKMKAELEAKEAKYAEMDKGIESAEGIHLDEEGEGGELRYRTSEEIDREYPNWLEGTTTDTGKHSTQVEGTRKTYGKIGNWIEKNLGKDVSILDASSGMGYGTRDLRDRGFNIEDVEPYQSEQRRANNPATYDSYSDVKKKYDYIISNAVLNVIPDDWRRDVLHNMAERLSPGGRLFINTRKAGEEKAVKDKIELDTPQEILVKRNGKIASYQRFFTPSELKNWVEEELGEGYSVEIANEKNSGTKGLAAVVVKRLDGDNFKRDGEGPQSDYEINMATDLIARVQGYSNKTPRQQRAWADRERQHMNEIAKTLGKNLGLNIDIRQDNTGLKGRRARAKGWYDISDGKITVIIGNHTSAADVEKTILHEAVAHYGLRQLLGKHFDEFLDVVYEHSEDSIREEIDRLTDRMVEREAERLTQQEIDELDEIPTGFIRDAYKEKNRAKAEKKREEYRKEATEEFMADVAENTDFENAETQLHGWFSKIKKWFIDILFKLGFKHITGRNLGLNELRYVLWRSYQNLKNPGRYRGFEWEAEDIAMRAKTGVLKEQYPDEGSRNINKVAEAAEKEMIEAENARYNQSLERYSRGELKASEVIEVGRPIGVVRNFMPDEVMILRKGVIKKALNKHGLKIGDLQNLPEGIAKPLFIFQRDKSSVSLLTAVKGENGKNLFVSIELGVKKPISKELTEINDITTIHGRDVENVILPILENETLKYKDPLRGLQWIEDEKEAYRKRTQEEHSAELNPQSITLETFDDAAKVIENFENPKFGGGEIEEGGHEEEGLLFRDGESLTETIERMTTEAEQANVDNLATKRDAMLALGGNLNKLRSVMARQREYDTSTVRSITGLVNTLMERGLLDDISKYETKRILSVAGNVVGRQDISKYVDKVMDILVENQLRGSAKAFGQLLSIKGSKVDARGIEVQGILDPDGQRIAQVVKKTSTLPKADIEEKILEALNRMGSSDIAISEEAALEYAGLQISRQYAEDITESKAEERSLRESIKQAKEDKEAGQMTEASYRQYVEATEDAIRQNKAERAEAYQSLIEQMSGVLGESIDRAKAWKNAEVARVKAIQHNANSDMEGRPTDEHHKNSRLQKLSNNSGVRFLLAPLATFDQMLRMFGKKNVGGEGYLWNRYMRGWVDATEKEYTGYRDALKVLDDKAREIFAPGAHTTKDSSQRGRHRIKSFGDLFVLDRQLPKGSVRFWDGGEMKEHELTQGNMLYIYMTDKMADGRMKLRRMGITEEDIEDIKDFLDPRFIELADWIQEEFLTEKRNEYNEVHKRMFGASMAAIENYFPLKILANARTEDVDVADDTTDTALPSTSTGSIIKRRRNNLALDVTGANAFSVILDHLQQMERWAAFAEYNRDLNTLLSYKRFRNQVMNMNSAYGAGKTLWNNFRNVAAMSAGSYRPPIAALDKSAVNIAKGVTAAKVSFRMFTALKQFLSMPAYMSEVNPLYLGKSLLNPIKAWRWSMENLPLFEKRWKSRMAGDPRLMKTEMDWKAWRNNIVQIASRIGMSPNAFVDALTVAIGTYPKYETNYKKYLRQGYSKEEADKRAKEDASILFNQTQQSSEGAFLSTMQVDRSWLSVLFTVFRNSSMSYTRQLYDAIRNLKGRGIELFNPGERQKTIDFMAKQLLRTQKPEEEGVWSAEDWSRAKKSAEAGYKSSILRDLARVGIFGFALQLAWNLGAYLPYLILGEDEEEKGKMWRDAMSHAMFGSVEGLTGGDVMSGAGQMFMTGEGNLEYLSKEMPLAGDVMNILKKMPKDQLSAMNDIINLIVQSGVGVNPQSLTDAVVAVMDATNGDMETGREAALMIARIMNCPQSQLDKIYFDEIDAIGTEASRMTPGEIAERYARYKIRREAPLTGWMRDESTGDSIKSQREKRVFKAVEEKLDGRMATEETKKLMEEYESYAKDKRALSAIDKDENPDEYWEAWEAFQEKWGPEADWRYKRLQEYKRDIKAMTDSLLSKSISVEEMQGIVERMIRARDVMLEETSE